MNTSEQRAKIYEYFKAEGFEMTKDRHKQLKKLLIEYVNIQTEMLNKQIEDLILSSKKLTKTPKNVVIQQPKQTFKRTFKPRNEEPFFNHNFIMK